MAISSAQFDDSPFDLEHPAVAYGTRPTATAVDALNVALQSGQVNLPFETITGHLKSVLDALDVRVDSQVVVFSKTSLQSRTRFTPATHARSTSTTRSSSAWVRGGFIEIAAQDPQQGAVFYRVLQAPTGSPACFATTAAWCHNSFATLGVPGFSPRAFRAPSMAAPCSGSATT